MSNRLCCPQLACLWMQNLWYEWNVVRVDRKAQESCWRSRPLGWATGYVIHNWHAYDCKLYDMDEMSYAWIEKYKECCWKCPSLGWATGLCGPVQCYIEVFIAWVGGDASAVVKASAQETSQAYSSRMPMPIASRNWAHTRTDLHVLIFLHSLCSKMLQVSFTTATKICCGQHNSEQ